MVTMGVFPFQGKTHIVEPGIEPGTSCDSLYEGKSIKKLKIVIEKRRMGIMTYKQHLFFNVISKQI